MKKHHTSSKHKTSVPTEEIRRRSNEGVDTRIKELGKRARARGEEERSKRREIVVLKQDYQPAVTAVKRRTSTTQKSSRKQTISKQQQQQGTLSTSSPLSSSVKKSGAVVQVSGLASSCTPEMIRRFFSGLTPTRIVVFPSTSETSVLSDYNSARLVVWISFGSAMIAQAAVQRSGETMAVRGDNREQLQHKKNTTIIIVTSVQLPSRCIQTILKYLAIDAIPGECLEETQRRTESEVLPSVLSLLNWVVKRDKQADDDARHDTTEDGYPWNRLPSCKQIGTNTTVTLFELTTFCEELVHELEQMTMEKNANMLLAQDPGVLASDPTVRFHHLACQELERYINRCKRTILLRKQLW